LQQKEGEGVNHNNTAINSNNKNNTKSTNKHLDILDYENEAPSRKTFKIQDDDFFVVEDSV
jgi:hypothetical protein